MFFILSTGRSGTQFIAKLLSSVRGCVCSHEPAPELILESSGYRYGTVVKSELVKILRDTRSPTVDGFIYCEANQTLSLIVPALNKAFPEARYIWLIRNGLDFVASAYQKQWYSGHSENHDRYEDCPPLEKMWIDGRIQGDRCGDMNTDEWEKLDRFGRCCWYWSYVNRIIEHDLKMHCADDFMSVRLEEIDREFDNLVEWMGVEPLNAATMRRSNIAKKIPYHWTEWSKEQRRVFELWCGNLMDRFYPDWRIYTNESAKIYVVPALEGLKQQVEEGSIEAKKQRTRIKEQRTRIKKQDRIIRNLKSELNKKNGEVEQLIAEKKGLNSELTALRGSVSWKMTKPLRTLKTLLTKPLGH